MTSHRPRKRFGQHFLSDPGVIDEILRRINATADDIVVEIGPGLGAITDGLAATAGHLHLVELDRDLAAALRRKFGGAENVTVHEADALGFDFSSLGERIRVVGNLPYNISTPLLFRLLEFGDQIADMHFMLQKEVVDRMAAEPGSKADGRLSIMLGCRLEVEALFDVDRSAFDPPPKVQSAVVRLDPLPADRYEIADPALLNRLVAAAFSKRRKTIRNALKQELESEVLEAVGIDSTQRPEQIGIDKYVQLANHLSGTMR